MKLLTWNEDDGAHGFRRLEKWIVNFHEQYSSFLPVRKGSGEFLRRLTLLHLSAKEVNQYLNQREEFNSNQSQNVYQAPYPRLFPSWLKPSHFKVVPIYKADAKFVKLDTTSLFRLCSKYLTDSEKSCLFHTMNKLKWLEQQQEDGHHRANKPGRFRGDFHPEEDKEHKKWESKYGITRIPREQIKVEEKDPKNSNKTIMKVRANPERLAWSSYLFRALFSLDKLRTINDQKKWMCNMVLTNGVQLNVVYTDPEAPLAHSDVVNEATHESQVFNSFGAYRKPFRTQLNRKFWIDHAHVQYEDINYWDPGTTYLVTGGRHKARTDPNYAPPYSRCLDKCKCASRYLNRKKWLADPAHRADRNVGWKKRMKKTVIVIRKKQKRAFKKKRRNRPRGGRKKRRRNRLYKEEATLSISNRRYQELSGVKSRRQFMNKKMKALEKQTSQIPTNKTVSKTVFEKHVRVWMQSFEALRDLNMKKSVRRKRFDVFCKKRATIHRFSCEMTQGNKKSVVVFGDGTANKGYGRYSAVPIKTLRRYLQQRSMRYAKTKQQRRLAICRSLVVYSEVRTSARCAKRLQWDPGDYAKMKFCHGINERVIKDVRSGHLIHKVLACQKCRTIWDRDVNAYSSIRDCFWYQLKHPKHRRPAALTHSTEREEEVYGRLDEEVVDDSDEVLDDE